MELNKKQEVHTHKIGIYLWIWGLLFVFSFFSYMVDYLNYQGLLRWTLIVFFMLAKAGFIMAIFMHLYWERWAIVNVLLWPMTLIGVFIANHGCRILLYLFLPLVLFCNRGLNPHSVLKMTTIKSKTLKLDYFSYMKAFFNLMKPRVMSLVIFTCVVGLLIAPVKVNFLDVVFSLLAVALGSGAAGALNMWYESDLDSLMTRTCLRPIPTGKLTRNQALAFGILSSLISVIVLYIFSNLIAATLLATTILFYVFVYTIWLKRKTPQNIVIGGASGALPPLIGWAIATNGIALEPIILFLIIFIWTPSHFWALSLYKSEDYRKAKIPMLPITSGIKTTKFNIFIYALILFPVVISPFFLNFSGLTYFILATILSGYYIFISFKLLKEKNSIIEKKLAAKLFGYSIIYLFMIFTSILIDRVI